MSWIKNNLLKIKDALFKTRSVVEVGFKPTSTESNEYIEINTEFYETLLEKFVKADVGFDLSEKIVSELKKKIKDPKIDKQKFQAALKEIIRDHVGKNRDFSLHAVNQLNIFLIVGVNGSGKTTSIGKLAKRFKEGGFKVLIVAGDTFRAAAGEQLDIWAEKAGVEIYSPTEIKKPDAVIFNSIEKAKNENYNLLLIDTAGRLHTQTNLMDELKKIDTVVVRAIRELPRRYEKLIVLDATIGQNAITQAELFSKAIGLTGIILSKLDSSAKGGVILNIMNRLSLPVRFIGLGETIDDIIDFNLDEYLEGFLS